MSEEPDVNYGFTCFSCRTMIDFTVPSKDAHLAAEDLAGAAGWCIGHYDGQGQIACPDCKDAMWEAALLGTEEGRAMIAASPDKGEGG